MKAFKKLLGGGSSTNKPKQQQSQVDVHAAIDKLANQIDHVDKRAKVLEN